MLGLPHILHRRCVRSENISIWSQCPFAPTNCEPNLIQGDDRAMTSCISGGCLESLKAAEEKYGYLKFCPSMQNNIVLYERMTHGQAKYI